HEGPGGDDILVQDERLGRLPYVGTRGRAVPIRALGLDLIPGQSSAEVRSLHRYRLALPVVDRVDREVADQDPVRGAVDGRDRDRHADFTVELRDEEAPGPAGV